MCLFFVRSLEYSAESSSQSARMLASIVSGNKSLRNNDSTLPYKYWSLPKCLQCIQSGQTVCTPIPGNEKIGCESLCKSSHPAFQRCNVGCDLLTALADAEPTLLSQVHQSCCPQNKAQAVICKRQYKQPTLHLTNTSSSSHTVSRHFAVGL